MSLSKYNETEGIKLIEGVKKGNMQNKQIIVESFKWLIKSCYGKLIN